MLKLRLKSCAVLLMAFVTMSSNAQYFTSDRRMSGRDRSRYHHAMKYGDVLEVRNDRSGNLVNEIPVDMYERVRMLVVDGPLNGDDIKLLRDICQRKRCVNDKGQSIDNFIDIDLSAAWIVSGGGYYYSYTRTTRDVVSDYMFYDCSRLRSIILPERIQAIGSHAFRSCNSLEEVIMPNSVMEIGDEAFDNCYGLRYVLVSENLQAIGDEAFSSCSNLREIYLPRTLRYIGKKAFSGTGLSRVELPSGLETLGANAFGRTSLKTLFIPANTIVENGQIGTISTLQSIEVEEGNKTLSSYQGIMYTVDGTRLLYCPCALSGTVDVPEGVTVIGNLAFYSCESLTGVTLPASVTSIGNEAFSYCTNLQQVLMPPSLTAMGTNVFQKCKKLTSINVPDGLVSLPKETFHDCESLSYVSLPNTLKILEKESLRNTKSLKSIDLPLGLQEVAKEAFRDSGLEIVELPNGVTSIGENAFRSTQLTQFTIPASVTTIGKKPLEKCKKLEKIICLATTPPTLEKASNDKIQLFVPAGSVDSYKQAKNWKSFKNILPLE